MTLFQSPEWVRQFNHSFLSIDDIPSDVFSSINERLDKIQSSAPVVSIVIGAWNEEKNILNCIDSLSRTKTDIPLEIIVVNNKSTDGTQAILDKLHVRSLFQPIQGNGPARQMGQENAFGEYILLADADCIYPVCWVESMFNQLIQPDVVCVYGRYSFIEEKGYPRWKLFLYERIKDIIAEIRHFKRPYLNAFGISMGYVKEFGIQEGFINRNIRGNDGRLCFDLMKYGMIKQMKSSDVRVWTGPRTLERDGGLTKAFLYRLKNESMRLFSFLRVHPPHNTKVSENE